jgi:hypothetical protein
VLPDEPPSADEPALGWPRTLLSPHAAWFSPGSAAAPYRRAAEAVAAVLQGREPPDAIARPRLCGLLTGDRPVLRPGVQPALDPADCAERALGAVNDRG